MKRHTARRFMIAVAGALSGVLVLAGPAGATCIGGIASYDDGSAEATLDLDYGDDYASKTFTAAATVEFTTGMYVVFSASSYGGCGSYALSVNGTYDHSFDTCTPGWQAQPITVALLSPTVSIAVTDIDGTWATGIYFDVDTNNGGYSYMYANGVNRSGELIWRIAGACV